MAVHLPPFELDGFTAYITLFGCKTGCNLNFFGLEIISGSKPIPCIPCEVITSSIYLMFHPYCLRNQKTSNAGKIKKRKKKEIIHRGWGWWWGEVEWWGKSGMERARGRAHARWSEIHRCILNKTCRREIEDGEKENLLKENGGEDEENGAEGLHLIFLII